MKFRFLAASFILLALVATALPRATYADEASDRRAQLTKELGELEAQIAANQAKVDALAAQGQSLSRDVQVLDAEIKKAQLQVQATQVAIRQIDGNIAVHSKTISDLSSKLDREHESLAQILRDTDQLQDFSVVEVALSAEDVSSFFSDLDAYTTLKQSLSSSFDLINDTRTQTEKEKDALEEQRQQQAEISQLQAAAKQKVVDQQSQKKSLLTATKGQESTYKQIVASQQKTAAQIRAELFALAGTGGGAIPLGTAIDNAKVASRITGVRPALILAILSQESDLGKNTGQCLVTSIETGDGKGKNTGTPFPGTMKAPRDTVVFERLMSALGRDWSTTAVSCPQPGGYGGAMGPTQFIPSTWVLYEARIKSALGVAATDPWNALHAIVATGMLLADNGASAQTTAAERQAAGMYYAGGNWATSGQVYANSVMAKAAQFQADIDTLAGS
jgi:membrane-bound lytic murein transglycosylase B